MELESDTYDLIVLGTGFAESVIAGAVARNGLKVLHLDYNDYYGGYTASNPLNAFEKLLQATPEAYPTTPEKWPTPTYTCIPTATQPAPKFTNVKIYSNPEPEIKEEPKETTTTTTTTTEGETKSDEQETKSEETTKEEETTKGEPTNPRSRFQSHEALMKTSRQYSIGDMVNLLISSSVGRYLEFKCFEKTYLLAKDAVQPVPCSKGDIFQSKYITNMERRQLTRFMQLIQSDLAEPGKIDPTKFGSFYEFIKSQSLSANLEMFILYAISLCASDQQTSPDKISAAEGLRVLETYVSSVSRYGNTPFLCPLYGNSEIPQAFCRLCAVYGGVYVLRRSAECLLVDPTTNQFFGVVSQGQTLKASNFITTGSYFPDLLGATSPTTRLSRAVVIIDQPIMEVDTEKGHATFLIVPPSSQAQNTNAVHILQLDHSLSVAPRGKYVLHFITETTNSAEQDLQTVVAHFVNVSHAADSEIVPSKPFAQWVGYFNVSMHTPASVTSPTYPKGVYIVSEGCKDKTEVDYKDLLQEARDVFKLIYPEQEFLPKVPNPEDIIWGGDPVTENTEGNTTQTVEGETEGDDEKQETQDKKEEEQPAEKKVEEQQASQ